MWSDLVLLSMATIVSIAPWADGCWVVEQTVDKIKLIDLNLDKRSVSLQVNVVDQYD